MERKKIIVALLVSCGLTLAYATGTALATTNVEESGYDIVSRDVIVQEGDTFRSIARRELGKSGFSSLLADHNRMNGDDALVPGTIVRIPIHVPARGEYAEVVFVKGTVTVTRRSLAGPQATLSASVGTNSVVSDAGSTGFTTEVIQLTRNSQIYSGDLITTSDDGYASVVFSCGAVINLQPDTTAALERLACLETDDSCQIEINTQRGQVTSNVETRDQQPMLFRVTTPYASAAVRGTVFDVDAADKILVGVVEGVVDVVAQNESVALNEGFGLSVEEGEAPGMPMELIPAPVFKRVPARFTEGDTLEWWSFIDAAGYLAKLSNDEAGSEVLTDFNVPDNLAILDLAATLDQSIAPGDYFITVRAVSADGLKGFPTNTRITLASIDPAIETVSTTAVQEGSELLVTVENRSDIAMGYEIQISSDEAFSDPLSADVNENGTAVFRNFEDRVYSRARVLVDPYTVSAFGEPSAGN